MQVSQAEAAKADHRTPNVENRNGETKEFPLQLRAVCPSSFGRQRMSDHGAAADTSDTDTYYPELVLSLCAAVGTDTKIVSDSLSAALLEVGYTPILIRLSALMVQLQRFEYISNLTAE